MDARSRNETTPVTGGYVSSSGKTIQSLASSSGTHAMPAVMWIPCVSR